MPDMFKRTFRGYDTESVQQEIDKINRQFEEKINELKKEIVAKTNEKESLEREFDKLKQTFGNRADMQESIKEKLLEEYLDVSHKHLKAVRQMEESISDLKNKVKVKQEELSKYKGYSNKIKSDILKIRDRFENILEWKGDDK